MRERHSHRHASLPSAISLLNGERADDGGLVTSHFPYGAELRTGRTRGKRAFMKAYSQDVREPVLRAVDLGRPRAEIVQLFGVSLAPSSGT